MLTLQQNFKRRVDASTTFKFLTNMLKLGIRKQQLKTSVGSSVVRNVTCSWTILPCFKNRVTNVLLNLL